MEKTGNHVKRLFAASPMLLVTAAIMSVDLLLCIAGLLTDHTIITGDPAWLKPTKFAISTGIYVLSVAMVVQYTPVWKRTLRVAEFLIGLSLTIEIVVIDMQAARHTTSHFNLHTGFDAMAYMTMGISILFLWFSSAVVAIATFRTRYRSPHWTTAVRYGLLLSVLGAGAGAFMVTPSKSQLDLAHKTGQMPIVGSHTVGGADGGKGIPVVGWSSQYGDVRVAHFTGMHALQIMALLALFLDRRRISALTSQRIITAATISYAAFFLIALIQAGLRLPITSHDAAFITTWLIWASLSAILLFYAARSSAGVQLNKHSSRQAAA